MKRSRRIWLILIIIAIGAAAATYIWWGEQAVSAEAETGEAELQTAVARRGELVVSAIGAGTVIPVQEVALTFGSSGRLVVLSVQVGDDVAAGDLLARIDDTTAQQALENAQLQYRQAQMQADGGATSLGVSFDDISVAQAELNLTNAQVALEELRSWKPDPDEIAQAEAALAAAEAAYNAARGQEAASSTGISVSGINVDQAERALADAQAAYDTAFDPGRDWELEDPRRADALLNERDRAAEALLRAEETLQIAQLNYNSAVAGSNSSSTASAEHNLLNAQLALAAARSGPLTAEMAAAETAVRQAELAYQQALLNQEADRLSMSQAALNVAAAETVLAGTELTAPLAGTVTAVNFAVGETVSGSAIVLADLAQPLLEVYLDESDLNMIGLDYEVEVVFDALPDETFTGTVVQVDPQLVTSSNVTTVRALVQLDAFNKPQTMPVGLNATVEVIGGRAENAVLVPVEALREIGGDQYAVFVMRNGEPQLQMVEVGIMDYSFAVIISGVAAGDEVTTGILQTQQAGE